MKSHRRDQLEVQRTASAGVLGAVAIVGGPWLGSASSMAITACPGRAAGRA